MLTHSASVTMPWAIPPCLEMSLALRIQLLVTLRWRIVIQMGLGTRTSTVLLALRRSRGMLGATRTTLLAFRLLWPTPTVCSTKPWALSLCQLIALALQTSPSVTRRRLATQAVPLTRSSATRPDQTLPPAPITFTLALAPGQALAT